MKLTNIIESSLYVDDFTKAEAFYVGILGLEKIESTPDRDMFLRCGDMILILFNPEKTQINGGRVPTHGSFGQGHLAFEIPNSDFESWVHYLEENGVAVEQSVDWGEAVKSIYFRDPSGNSLELISEGSYKE